MKIFSRGTNASQPSRTRETQVDYANDSEDELSYIPSNYTLSQELSEYIQTEPYFEIYPGTESIEYDYTAERQNVNSTNIIESTGYLIKGCIGAGILGMHEAYMYGGLWTSLGLTAVIAFVVSYTMWMLVNSAQLMYVRIRVPRLSYPDLAEAALATGPLRCCRRFSKLFRYTVDLCLFLELFGSCCVYQIIIATSLKQAAEATFAAVKKWQLDIRLYILISMAQLLFLCSIRKLKVLATISIVADVCIFFCVAVTIYYSIIAINEKKEVRSGWKDVYGMFHFCGTCIYSVEGVTVVLPIENHMRKPKFIVTVLQFGMLITFFSVSLIGFLGYWAWGDKCVTPITSNMPKETLPIVLQFLLAMMLSVTFSIHFWVPFRTVWHYISKMCSNSQSRDFWEVTFRIIQVILITAFAAAYPNLNSMMSFLGAFFLAFTGFIFPAVIDTLVTWKEHHGYTRIRWRFIKNLFIITTALCFCMVSLYSNLRTSSQKPKT